MTMLSILVRNFAGNTSSKFNKVALLKLNSLKLALSGNKFVGSSLIGLYSKFSKMNDSRGVFEEIINKDIVAYTSMITGYSETVDSIAWNAFEIATDMLQNNLEVNRVTLESTWVIVDCRSAKALVDQTIGSLETYILEGSAPSS
uniref:Uncharacterized protein n=1 Tax=Oryza meridionalis TaxID=40149 RepID=A0A0E0C1U2_9ORYZ